MADSRRDNGPMQRFTGKEHLLTRMGIRHDCTHSCRRPSEMRNPTRRHGNETGREG